MELVANSRAEFTHMSSPLIHNRVGGNRGAHERG